VGLSIGWQVNLAEGYVREWEETKAFFWQMSWRIPSLEPGTLIFLNDSALTYYADNSLSAGLNWTFGTSNQSGRADYWLFHPRSRLGGSLPVLEAGQSIQYNFLAGVFDGNTSHSLSLDYSPPRCLRVLDPGLDPVNPLLHPTLRATSSFSKTELILTEGAALVPTLFGPEPEHTWCFYFEKADLARQQGKWQEVVELGDEAMSQKLRPASHLEWMIFIESYAHTGAWMRSLDSTGYVSSMAPYLDPVLCNLWTQILQTTSETPERNSTLKLLVGNPICHP
jgi:hypothetical protein